MNDLLEIFTFGGLELRRGGEPVGRIGSHRVEAMLVYLACNRHAHPRELLADMLWDNRPQPRAMANLRVMLSGLRKHFGPYVVITRETASLNPESHIWLDALELDDKLAVLRDQRNLDSAESAAQVEEAVALFRGDFLEGFHLRGAWGFEEWLTGEREYWRQQVLDGLSQLVAYHLVQGNYKAGIAQAHRLLQLDPWLEEGHRQLMRLLAYSDQRTAALAQFKSCRRMLAEEFGVAPAAETTTLFEQIQADTLEIPAPATIPSPKLPAFLKETAETTVRTRPVFVARHRELARLDEHLTAMLEGDGRILFVIGEAGRGKTALMEAFAARAQETQPELVVAGGHCNAYWGFGDPYLPFRDILEMLSGNLEPKWAAGIITQEQARRVWHMLPYTLQALVEEGPGLINLFTSGPALLKRATTCLPERTACLQQLKEIIQSLQSGPEKLEPGQLLEQYTQVMHTVARQHPLLLLLDDLQWADGPSINLLFHLGRRLAGSRVLILGAYRPSELSLGRPFTGLEPQRRHALEAVINELKRYFGDIQIDLGQIPKEERQAFVNAWLDSEPNRLGETFRTALFRQTEGHPLFTIELLREMQQRGDLGQDEDGHWIEGAALNWTALPVRVEAVIEQRLGRLDRSLQDMLTLASVEGEEFTAQVLAGVQEIDQNQLLHQLTRELEQRHRLVRDRGEVAVGSRRFSRFSFGHVLFQQYLYGRITPAERQLFHGQVAACLEELYGPHVDEIALQLARHYLEAGQPEQAVAYLLKAGDQARLRYAHQEAVDQYRPALTILQELGQYERAGRTSMKLGLTYHNAFEFHQADQAYEEGFRLWRQAERHLPDTALPSAPHPLRLVWYPPPTTLDPTRSADFQSSVVIGQLFSGLVEESPEMEVVPEVAHSWEVSKEGCRYIFHLREDVRWSDGTPVTARDFEYGSRWLLDPTNKTELPSLLYDIKRAREFHNGDLSDPEQVGVRALDEVTLALELEGPTPYFLHLLTNLYPIPSHVVKLLGEAWAGAENIVTNGPFRLSAWQPEQQTMILERNPTYHGHFTGNLQQMELYFQADWSDRLERYERDTLDVMNLFLFPRNQRELVRQRHPDEYLALPELGTWYLAFDVSRAPFNDPRVRRAFALATDREALVNAVWRDHARPARGGFLPPGIPGHSPEMNLPYAPRQARYLLAQSGYPEGGRRFPAIEALVPDTLLSQSEFLQKQWYENLGVEVAWQATSWSEAEERLNNRPAHLTITGWGADYPDPDSFLRPTIIASGTKWRCKTYDKLVETARRMIDQEKRLQLYQQADKILMAEVPILPLGYGQSGLLLKPWVRRYPTSPLAIHYWFGKEIILEPHSWG